MFLDDTLYQHTIERQINDPSDLKDLINELFRICEANFKPLLTPDMTYREGSVILDRVFLSWDLFVKRLKKEKWFLADMIEKYSYKSNYLGNEKLNEIYLKGK
jgi:hypothetical protein